MSSLCPLSCFQSFSYPLQRREELCWVFCSWIHFFKLLALVTIYCLNSCFLLLTAVVKMLYTLGRAVDCAREERLSQRGNCCSVSPAKKGHLSHAGSNAQQMPGYFAPLTVGWERAGMFSCRLPKDSEGKEALGDHLGHCFPIFSASVFTRAADDVFFTGLPRACRSQTCAPCLIGRF